jgi:group I intron endonuclease
MSNTYASGKFSGVYVIKHVDSGKQYVGSSKLMFHRFKQHKAALNGYGHQNSHLQYAWNKYGQDAFEFKVILICDKYQMRYYEQLIMDSFKPEFNQSKSAYSGIAVGATCLDSHKAKVGITSRERWNNTEYRTKVTKAIQASMTDDECQKRSDRTKLLWSNPEYRAKSILVRQGQAYNKGYKCTPEQVENRKKAGRISNIKRNYGQGWKIEYIRRYPDFVGDI